ncbi:sensor histidine kinase [Galactobacter valiniphilus]|uniref:sensor histidine kinase n=1 Tax=Galactobacter valiniphilus TaxID=2676122 RepID=UPI003735004E
MAEGANAVYDDASAAARGRAAGTARPGRSWGALVVAVLGCAGVAAGVWLCLSRPGAWVRVELAAGPAVAGLGVVLVLLATVGRTVVLRRRAALARERAAALAAATLVAEEEAQAARRRFLRRLDHELKNPVTALKALAAQGTEGLGGDRAWATAGIQAQRMARLVGDLRGLAELEVSQLDLEPVRVDEVVTEALDDLAEAGHEALLQQRDVRVHLPVAPWPLPEVNGEPDLLRLVFHNVIGNALKYTAPGERVEITGVEDAQRVIVEVADTGRGIPEAEAELVFEELARARNVADLPGSGVGLALVKVIVQRHGGEVSLRSREGRGTSVRISLPARGGERAEPAPRTTGDAG